MRLEEGEGDDEELMRTFFGVWINDGRVYHSFLCMKMLSGCWDFDMVRYPNQVRKWFLFYLAKGEGDFCSGNHSFEFPNFK